MAVKVKELRNKRGAAVHKARAIFTIAEERGEAMSASERSQWQAHIDESQDLKEEIRIAETMADEERDAAVIAENDNNVNPGGGLPAARDEAVMKEFRSFITGGAMGPQMRDLQATIDVGGGFTVTPEQVVKDLIKKIDDLTFIRQRATVIPVIGAQDLGVISLDADPSDPDWTSEVKEVTADSDMAFGKRHFKPTPLSKLVKVSMNLLNVSALPVEELVNARMAYKFNVAEEKGFLVGTGSGEPLGVFTASDQGVGTARDITTGTTTTAMTAATIIAAKYNLKAGYRKNASWLFHRDGIGQVAGLKDGNGQFIWRPGLTENVPDMLSGSPVDESEFAPNTFTAGNYVGMYGDFSYYWIADSLSFGIQRLAELFARTNQIGFIGRAMVDGMPALGEAFTRIKLVAS